MEQSKLVIERISMPEAAKKGDKYMPTIMQVCTMLVEIGTSVFVPEADTDKNRREYVYRANKFGKEIGKTFTCLAEQKNTAIEVKDADGKVTPKVTIIKGIRIYLTGFVPKDAAKEVVLPELAA